MKNSEIKDLSTYCSEVEVVANVLGTTIENAESLINNYPDLDVSMLLARGFHNQTQPDGNIYDGMNYQQKQLKQEIDAIKKQQL